jgi:DNA modification methylase
MTVNIINGDCRAVLPTLDAESFDCIVTSPPYWGLRDYGTATWEGGDADCDHSHFLGGGGAASAKQMTSSGTQKYQYRDICGKCGARRVDSQIGLEPTLDAYVEEMASLGDALWRVLKPSGTFWLNLGDSYSMSTKGSSGKGDKQVSNAGTILADRRWAIQPGLKPKDLCGVPWRVAFALQARGWWLRSAIVWHKPNPMPESVTDRPTSAYEMVFLLTKADRYFYDADAIADAATFAGKTISLGEKSFSKGQSSGAGVAASGNALNDTYEVKATRNARNVWTISTQPFKGSHFATMPPDLAERCIKAGTSEKGCCPHCGKAWFRNVEQDPCDKAGRIASGEKWGPQNIIGAKANNAGGFDRFSGQKRFIGWRPTCDCPAHEPIPARVLDPFGGAGTTGLVADRLGRNATLIELNPAYRDMGAVRITDDAPLFANVQ